MSGTVSATTEIAAAPAVLCPMVSDVTRMGQWSDETSKARWTKGATGPKVGATFTGSNRNGWHRWSTQCTVTAFEPGKTFAFSVKSMGLPVSTWTYTYEPTETGTRVTETWVDQRPGIVRTVGRFATGRPHDADDNLVSMKATLASLKAAAEKA